MGRKQVVFAAAATGASLAVAGGISAVLASGQTLPPGPKSIRITATQISDVRVDTGHPGRSAGDLEIIRERLFNRRITPRAIGHSEMVCTSTGGTSSNCNATYFLPKGKIVISGPRTFREIFEVAVVGGTGIYENVRGTLTVTSLGGKPERCLLFFRLLFG